MLTDFEDDEARPGRYPVTFSNRMQDKKAHPGLLSKESVFQVAEACARVVSAPSSRTKHVASAGLLKARRQDGCCTCSCTACPRKSAWLSVSHVVCRLPFTHQSIDCAHNSHCKEHSSCLAGLAAHTKPLRESGPGASPSRPIAGFQYGTHLLSFTKQQSSYKQVNSPKKSRQAKSTDL